LAFGRDGLFRTNNPADQEKAIVYNELVANAVALKTMVDQTLALHALKSGGVRVGFTVMYSKVDHVVSNESFRVRQSRGGR